MRKSLLPRLPRDSFLIFSIAIQLRCTCDPNYAGRSCAGTIRFPLSNFSSPAWEFALCRKNAEPEFLSRGSAGPCVTNVQPKQALADQNVDIAVSGTNFGIAGQSVLDHILDVILWDLKSEPLCCVLWAQAN